MGVWVSGTPVPKGWAGFGGVGGVDAAADVWEECGWSAVCVEGDAFM